MWILERIQREFVCIPDSHTPSRDSGSVVLPSKQRASVTAFLPRALIICILFFAAKT